MRWTLLAALAVCLPAGAGPNWQVIADLPEAVVSIDTGSVQPMVDKQGFHERHAMRAGQTDPASLRPVREILEKRLIDCRARRVATLSRAVFSTDDALIDHWAVKPREAKWQPLARDDPRLSLLCRRP
ncbi:MAG: hypothetical protein LDL19_04940 [Thiobacillus sp.]|nr:hypothetical protein [Thiobacillus sp.]